MSEERPPASDVAVPRKYIVEKPHLVETFRNSASFAKIIAYVQACSDAVEKTPRSARLVQKPSEFHPVVRFFVETFFPHLNKIVDEVPLEDMKQQRFGNKAFRTFHQRLDDDVEGLMQQLVSLLPSSPHGDGTARELAAYVRDSFGNSTRIDYGTGHELHFFVVLMICLEECGDAGGTLHAEPVTIVPLNFPPPAPVSADERDRVRRLRQEMVFDVFGAYLTFMRRLQGHYRLEPAGSHGVWGLDDYHHLPFIFGAAQLIDKEVPCRTDDGGEGKGYGAILPKHICDEKLVRLHADDYLYFAQIAWVRDNKTGPFFEHSSMLYNISGVETWGKIYTGMVKMYAAEVLAKFNVVQHLLFGSHLPWPEKVKVGVKSDDSMRLAVLYTLRHDNAVILQTHAKARGCDAAPRIRPLPSFSDFLPCLTEGAEKEPQCIRIAPLQLSPLTLKSFSAAIEPTRLSLPPPPPQPQPSCVDVAENTSQLFPSLLAPHFNTPLVLSAHHGRQKCSWNRCAELLRRAVESNGLAATWEQMRSSFCAAWVAAVWVDASTCTLTSPPPIRMPPAALPLGKMEMQAALLVAESAAVPCRVQRRQCVRGMPPLRVDDVAGKLGEMRSAFAAQETSLKRHLFTVTHTAGGAVATTPPPAAAIATQTVMEVETPPLASDADNVCSKSLELMGVVIPPFSCIHTVKKGRRPERPRWAEENLIGVKNSMQQKLELVLSFIPNCMTRVTELRFPEGKHVRQTLTLQNIAKKSLQKLCGSHLHRQRQQQYRQKIAGLLSTEKCHVMRGRDLANVALLHSTALLLSADCLKPPQSCSAVRRNIGDDDIYHPPPPLLKPSLGVHASAVTGPSLSWPLILLGDQGEEDGGGNCGEGSRVGPWRVFPREEELHSFWRLMERRMERPVNDGGDVEEWYHAAFLHDIRTMPLPYQEIAALVDDARLHYCYRLALHREKRRIGLL